MKEVPILSAQRSLGRRGGLCNRKATASLEQKRRGCIVTAEKSVAAAVDYRDDTIAEWRRCELLPPDSYGKQTPSLWWSWVGRF